MEDQLIDMEIQFLNKGMEVLQFMILIIWEEYQEILTLIKINMDVNIQLKVLFLNLHQVKIPKVIIDLKKMAYVLMFINFFNMRYIIFYLFKQIGLKEINDIQRRLFYG